MKKNVYSCSQKVYADIIASIEIPEYELQEVFSNEFEKFCIWSSSSNGTYIQRMQEKCYKTGIPLEKMRYLPHSLRKLINK